MTSVYVCYRGDSVEYIGTAQEVIDHYGWKGGVKTLRWYTCPVARTRGNFCVEAIYG